MAEIIDQLKKKAKYVKDKAFNATKGMARKTKDTMNSSVRTTAAHSNTREFEEGAAGTNTARKGDPLTEYSEKEP
jgi:hypothetical protein